MENTSKSSIIHNADNRDTLIIENPDIEVRSSISYDYIDADRYSLIINSKEVDTKKYEIFPNYHKISLDPINTLNIISQIKKGIKVKNAKDIITGVYCYGDSSENQLAQNSALQAFDKFKKLTIRERLFLLVSIRDILLTHSEKIISLMISEGLSELIASWELKEMFNAFADDTLDFYQEQIRRVIKSDKFEEIILHRKADGVVGVILPKNAPVSSSMLSLFSLLPGNTLIIKPPYKFPISVLYVWRIIDDVIYKTTGIKGVVNVIVGNSQKIVNEWLTNDIVKDILYYGNSRQGILFGQKALLHNKKAILELSGNDFIIVWDKQYICSSSEAFIDGFTSSGQVCMLPRNALLNPHVFDMFVENVTSLMKDNPKFNPSSINSILSPVINIEKFNEILCDATSKGAKLLCGGKRMNYYGIEDEDGAYIQPTVVLIEDHNMLREMRLYSDEIFLPILTITKINCMDSTDTCNSIIKIINDNPYGLRTSIWIDDNPYKQVLINNIDNAGTIRVNSKHISFSHFLPTHGGVGLTGGPYGGLNYFWEKTSHLQGISLTK